MSGFAKTVNIGQNQAISPEHIRLRLRVNEREGGLAEPTPKEKALELAATGTGESLECLATLLRIPSLTGEEGEAQKHLARLLRDIGGETESLEPDIKALFARFPEVAQYPTHWQHDLILPYARLPSYEALKASGLDSVLTYAGRPNVVATFRGTGGGRSLILNGHIDTVTIEPADEWTRDPFGAEVEGGLMYGRGASDMKGGLVAALMAMTYLKRAGAKLRGDVIFQSVVNEEHAGNGTLDLVRRGYAADGAIVLEPTNNTVAVSHPGGLYWQVKINGIQRSPGARWSGSAQEGVSAIEKLPPIINALVELERSYAAHRIDDPMEQGRSPFALVIGRVFGGFYESVTAGEATLRGGAYFAPGVGDIGEVMDRFRRTIDQANAGDAFLSKHPARLEFLHHDDSARQSRQVPLAVQMCRLLKERAGDDVIRAGPFACDMRHFVNQGGVPSIIFGPGTIAQAHKPDECIDLREYLDCIGHLIEFIWIWCNSEPDTATPDPPGRRA